MSTTKALSINDSPSHIPMNKAIANSFKFQRIGIMLREMDTIAWIRLKYRTQEELEKYQILNAKCMFQIVMD